MENHGSIIPVILANGDFPKHKRPLAILENANYLVCTDGSVNSLLNYQKNHIDNEKISKVTPSVIVGDGDSMYPELKQKFREIYVEYEEQDYNDLTKATRYCLEKGFNEIVYLGISGKRDDHAIANFSLLMWYLKNFKINLKAYTDYGVFIPCCGNRNFNLKIGTQISIFSFGAKNLKSSGLKWDLYDFDELWQGTLNEVVADNVSISADGYYLVFVNYNEDEV